MVEIGKTQKKVLHIQCQFPDPAELAEAGVEETEGKIPHQRGQMFIYNDYNWQPCDTKSSLKY